MIDIPQYLLQNKEPFFVCSRSVLRAQVEALKGLGVEVFYSVKTNPERCILEELQKLGVGFSVSGMPELLSVMSLGAKPEKVVYYERGLTKERAEKAIQAGCRNFVVESERAFESLSEGLKAGFMVLVRIKAEGGNGKYSGKYLPGVGLETAESIVRKCKGLGATCGLLHHGSSQTESPGDWRRKFDYLSGLPRADVVDIGGGIPLSYGGEDDGRVLEEIKTGIKRINAKRIIAEPGRFIVGPACSLVARVALVDGENAVLNCSVYNVHIDTIIADLVLPCRVLKPGKGAVDYRLLGSSLCNLDVFNGSVRLPKLEEGDAVVFDKAGAYNFSSDFCPGYGIKTYMVE